MKKMYVAGHAGMVGSAVIKKLKALDYRNLVTRSSAELNLISHENVNVFFNLERPGYVVL